MYGSVGVWTSPRLADFFAQVFSIYIYKGWLVLSCCGYSLASLFKAYNLASPPHTSRKIHPSRLEQYLISKKVDEFKSSNPEGTNKMNSDRAKTCNEIHNIEGPKIIYESLQLENESDKKDSKKSAKNKRKVRNKRKNRTIKSSAQSYLSEKNENPSGDPSEVNSSTDVDQTNKAANAKQLLAIKRRVLHLLLRTTVHLPLRIMILPSYPQRVASPIEVQRRKRRKLLSHCHHPRLTTTNDVPQ